MKNNIDEGMVKVLKREPNGFAISKINHSNNNISYNFSNCELFKFLYEENIIQSYPEFDFRIYKNGECSEILMRRSNS